MNAHELLNKWPELPDAYVDFVTNYLQLMLDTGDLSAVELPSDIDGIEQLNREIASVIDFDYEDLFAIGHSGCGDYYLMELGTATPQVILWDHETASLSESNVYGSIEEFASDMLAARTLIQEKVHSWWQALYQ